MAIPPKAFSPAEDQHCITPFSTKKSFGNILRTSELISQLPRKTLILLLATLVTLPNSSPVWGPNRYRTC